MYFLDAYHLSAYKQAKFQFNQTNSFEIKFFKILIEQNIINWIFTKKLLVTKISLSLEIATLKTPFHVDWKAVTANFICRNKSPFDILIDALSWDCPSKSEMLFCLPTYIKHSNARSTNNQIATHIFILHISMISLWVNSSDRICLTSEKKHKYSYRQADECVLFIIFFDCLRCVL